MHLVGICTLRPSMELLSVAVTKEQLLDVNNLQTGLVINKADSSEGKSKHTTTLAAKTSSETVSEEFGLLTAK